MFYKKVVPRNFPKFRPATLLKKSLWHKESTNPGFWSSDGLRGESAGGGKMGTLVRNGLKREQSQKENMKW